MPGPLAMATPHLERSNGRKLDETRVEDNFHKQTASVAPTSQDFTEAKSRFV